MTDIAMERAATATLTVDEARALLWSRVPSGESWGAHSETVARTAGTLADALAAAGEPVDPALARAGGLLHDIGRSITHHGTGHCWEGYQLLRGMGQPVLALFCVTHSYGGMTPEEAVRVGWPDADYRPRTWEEKVVTIADGLTHFARVVLLDERVASVLERYRHSEGTPDYALLADIVTKNRALMADVEAVIGQPVEPLVGAGHLDAPNTDAPCVFLSPHFDDVALSCGGTVASVAATGGARIVTVFGGVPPEGTTVTSYARELLAEWGAPSLAEAVRLRHAEDEAAARVLGASLVTLPFADGAFRGDAYPDWPALQTVLAPADANLPARIAVAVRATGLLTPETTLIGPLGAGRHVDHQAVFDALALLAPEVAAIWVYEDFPYAARQTDAVANRHVAVGLADAVPCVREIVAWLPTKIRAVACYPSQVPILFPDTPMPDAVRAYAEAVAGGTGGAAERFWSVGK